jgi:Uncharacterized lipoprotein NlpE involved in copper resistance.
MRTLPKRIKKNVTLILFSVLLASANAAWALSDMELQEKALKAREMSRHGEMDHSEHAKGEGDVTGFRGVFYGYLPCDEEDCDGLKMTLSLKQKNNYLLVTQPAKPSSREYYDKGKYTWDDKAHTLALTSKKDGSSKLFTIQDEGKLVLIKDNGTSMPNDQDAYALLRSDKNKSRQVHIH